MKYLLDSNILIYYLNGDKTIQDFFNNFHSECAISLISYYEVLNFNFSKEEEKVVKEFLEEFEILSLSKNIISQALKNRKTKKVKMADNFIIATAQIFDLILITRNTKDFTSLKQRILNPFEKS